MSNQRDSDVIAFKSWAIAHKFNTLFTNRTIWLAACRFARMDERRKWKEKLEEAQDNYDAFLKEDKE